MTRKSYRVRNYHSIQFKMRRSVKRLKVRVLESLITMIVGDTRATV
jgi:hypothetical protein